MGNLCNFKKQINDDDLKKVPVNLVRNEWNSPEKEKLKVGNVKRLNEKSEAK